MTLALQSLVYEPLSEEHAIELHNDFLDERLYHFIPEGPPRSLEALQREYAEFNAGAPAGSGEVWLNWAIRDGASGTCVGTLQATRFADGLLWVGYKIVPSAWGKGIATSALSWLTGELFTKFDGQPLLAAVDTRNFSSIRVLEKCQFKLQRKEPAELHGKQTEDFIFQYTGFQDRAA
ncbi:GNAT family N-acetyltransferase [Niveibacterium sp. 24ML]|uniref:GNAT family N-acetyltransferase n=1 Tax=Niveibacterium sp. 24ML TaxID=2985512 RepID=UPI002270D7C3|nr:GNAT family N-acetyltransferase [Niveibacterium sp. 24ML]MCX9158629.1 GNAT family N-acetyltransferase [Niveibacterium sp. 24ML]